MVGPKAKLFGPNMELQFILQKASKQSELICSSAAVCRFLLPHSDNEENFRHFQGYTVRYKKVCTEAIKVGHVM